MSTSERFSGEGSDNELLSPIDPVLANASPAAFAVPDRTPSSTPTYDSSPMSETPNSSWMGVNLDFMRSKQPDSHSSERGNARQGDMDEESGKVVTNISHFSGTVTAFLQSLSSSLKHNVAYLIAVVTSSENYTAFRNSVSNRLAPSSLHIPIGLKSKRVLSVAVVLIVVSIFSMIILSSSSSSSSSSSTDSIHQPSHLHGRNAVKLSHVTDEETVELNEAPIPETEDGASDMSAAPVPLTEEAVRSNEAASKTSSTPPAPRSRVAPSSVAVSNMQPQDTRYMYLRYDSPQGVKVFDCEQFPEADHKVLHEWHYLNADGTRPAFYQQQIRHQYNAFISCPASRPRIVILRAKFGRVFGTNQKTGEPVPFPCEWGGEYTQFEFSTGLREKCKGFRFCCINRAEWHFTASEIGMVSWYCEEGTVRQQGERVQHGSMVIHQSEMRVLANLHGTDSYADAAKGKPRVEAKPPLPPVAPTNARCTMSLHQSVHMYFGGQGAGLIHQISSLTSAIGMAAIAKCDVNSEGFYPDFDLLHPVPLGLVIDLNHWNLHLELHNFDVKIIDKVMDTHWYPFTIWPHGPHCVGIDLHELRNPPQQVVGRRPFTDFRSGQHPHNYIMGHMFPFWMFEDPPHVVHLRNIVVGDLQFTPPFRNAAAEIIKGLRLTPGEFIVIHFRLEADTKEFASRKGLSEVRWRETMFSKIVLSLQDRKIPDHAQIYLSTGLNSEDPYVQRFKNIFPNAVTKDMLLQECKKTKPPTEAQQKALPRMSLRPSRWDKKKNPALHALSQIPWTSHTDECGLIRGDEYENREYWASLDWLVARESKLFIGSQTSMYSNMMDKLITHHPRQWWDTGNIQTTFYLKDD